MTNKSIKMMTNSTKNDDQFNENDVIIIETSHFNDVWNNMRQGLYNITLEQALGIEIFNPLLCRRSWFWKKALPSTFNHGSVTLATSFFSNTQDCITDVHNF